MANLKQLIAQAQATLAAKQHRVETPEDPALTECVRRLCSLSGGAEQQALRSLPALRALVARMDLDALTYDDHAFLAGFSPMRDMNPTEVAHIIIKLEDEV